MFTFALPLITMKMTSAGINQLDDEIRQRKLSVLEEGLQRIYKDLGDILQRSNIERCIPNTASPNECSDENQVSPFNMDEDEGQETTMGSEEEQEIEDDTAE